MRDDLALVARQDRLEHVVPAVSAVHVAGTQSTAFEVAKLVEHEQGMIAGAGIMAVPDAHLLLAVGRAHARIHVEHDATRWPSAVHKVDPLARQVGKSSEVLGLREPLRLEAPHLTLQSRAPLRRFAADNPAHSRIVAQALGVVHILVSGKATKYRPPEQPGQCVSTILATACVSQNITRHLGQTEYVAINCTNCGRDLGCKACGDRTVSSGIGSLVAAMELAQHTSSSMARLPAPGAAGDGATARAPWPSPAPAVEIRLIAAAKSRFMGLHLFSCRGSVGVLNATSSNESPCCLAWNSEGCSQGGGSIHADLAAALTAVSRADYVVCGTLRDGERASRTLCTQGLLSSNHERRDRTADSSYLPHRGRTLCVLVAGSLLSRRT